MPSHFPAFALSVARRMEGYRERLAENIKLERQRRGETPVETAVAIGVDPRTLERWESGQREPQTKKLKALADYWGLEISALRPDLEAEERELRDQLNRLEIGQDRIAARLDQLLAVLTRPAAHDGDDDRFQGLADFGQEVRRLARQELSEDQPAAEQAPAQARRQAR
jgi:transcriptional regulator with XRE-family HTH domain